MKLHVWLRLSIKSFHIWTFQRCEMIFCLGHCWRGFVSETPNSSYSNGGSQPMSLVLGIRKTFGAMYPDELMGSCKTTWHHAIYIYIRTYLTLQYSTLHYITLHYIHTIYIYTYILYIYIHTIYIYTYYIYTYYIYKYILYIYTIHMHILYICTCIVGKIISIYHWLLSQPSTPDSWDAQP